MRSISHNELSSIQSSLFKVNLSEGGSVPLKGSPSPMVSIEPHHSRFAELAVEKSVIEDEAKKVEEHAAEIEVAPVVPGSRVEVSAIECSRDSFSSSLPHRPRIRLQRAPALSTLSESRQSPRMPHHPQMGTATRWVNPLRRQCRTLSLRRCVPWFLSICPG